MTPHKCPVCNGTGRIYKGGSSTSTVPLSDPCNACNSTGVVWEPNTRVLPGDLPPNFPNYPFIPPPFLPDPVVPLTWPKDFKFPDDIQLDSTDKLIKKFEDWIKELKKSKRKFKTKKSI